MGRGGRKRKVLRHLLPQFERNRREARPGVCLQGAGTCGALDHSAERIAMKEAALPPPGGGGAGGGGRGSVVVVVLHEEELAREGPAAPGMGLMPREGEGARLGKRSWREGGGARLQSGEAKGGLRRDAALAMAEKERGAIRNTSTGRSREYWVYPRESGGPESDVNPEHYLKHTI
eukprot:gene16876-biopygen2089